MLDGDRLSVERGDPEIGDVDIGELGGGEALLLRDVVELMEQTRVRLSLEQAGIFFSHSLVTG